MYRNYNYYQMPNGDERFIGPLIPFIGGALIGYVAGRPNYQPYYQPYPIYYQYPTYPYYYQTNQPYYNN